MTDLLFSPPTLWRLGAFTVVFLVMAIWELVEPWRALSARRSRRWTTHLALGALDAVLVRVVLPMGAVGVAWIAAREGWGLLRLATVERMPGWSADLFAIVALDLAIYAQHVAFHSVPWLWRLHRVHHADEHLDASSGLRFHPLEALLSLAWKLVVVVAIGASPVAVFVFEIALNLSSLFNHGNVALPRRVEPLARWLVVTPSLHRIHHSRERSEHDSNFGFNLPWWDRIFGTYRSEAAAGEEIVLGLTDTVGEPTGSLPWTLRAPFAEGVDERRGT